jgi:DNA-binding response OmpR family regulator
MPNRVLLCDDEIHILRAAEIKLRRAGFDVQIASDGEEAWAIIQTQPPEVLVTDCQMPRLDGFGLTQRIREDPSTRSIPVLMLTAKSFEISSEELAEKWDVRGVMAKPFSPRELVQKVQGILRDQQPPATAQDEQGSEVGVPCSASSNHAFQPANSTPEP